MRSPRSRSLGVSGTGTGAGAGTRAGAGAGGTGAVVRLRKKPPPPTTRIAASPPAMASRLVLTLGSCIAPRSQIRAHPPYPKQIFLPLDIDLEEMQHDAGAR